jgi:hypothetical protein
MFVQNADIKQLQGYENVLNVDSFELLLKNLLIIVDLENY